mmetsp:Transcript_31010/g.89624  ORF Transcript_31010/g.89624 Transcript_31010/m.89624 type:complete len:154 (+) Transcript_31010:37-498(+)
MAGQGYIALGLLSLLPAAVFIAAVAQDSRFRKGMPASDARRFWACILSVFTFPMTCGFVGQHKSQATLVAEELALLEGQGLSVHWDRYFLLFQLHLAFIVSSYILWCRVEPLPASPAPAVEAARQKRTRTAAWRGAADAPAALRVPRSVGGVR